MLPERGAVQRLLVELQWNFGHGGIQPKGAAQLVFRIVTFSNSPPRTFS
jgi:hypothetical protein